MQSTRYDVHQTGDRMLLKGQGYNYNMLLISIDPFKDV